MSDLVPTSQLLNTYSPELFCMVRNYAETLPMALAGFGGNGYSLDMLSEVPVGAANPYVYPDNLPRVNARGGPGGAPGAGRRSPGTSGPLRPWLPTRAPPSPVQPFRTRSTAPQRICVGASVRGEHDQPMKITGTAIKLGIASVILLLCTAMLVVVFGQLRFQRYNTYTAEFNNGSGLKSGQFVRAGGVEVGKVADVTLADNGQRVLVKLAVDKSLPIYQSTGRRFAMRT